MRYIKNNFLDGPRQDAYDLVTGTWVPRRGEKILDLNAEKQAKKVAVRAAPWVLVGAVSMLAVATFASNFVSGASSRLSLSLSLLLLFARSPCSR